MTQVLRALEAVPIPTGPPLAEAQGTGERLTLTVPMLAAVPALTSVVDSAASDGVLALSRRALRTLLAVNGRRTVYELAAERGYDAVSVDLASLADLRLIERSSLGGGSLPPHSWPCPDDVWGRLGEPLVAARLITYDQLAVALQMYDQSGVRLDQALLTLGYVAAEELSATLAEVAGVPFLDLRAVTPDPEVACLLSESQARTRGMLPLYDDGSALLLACTSLPPAHALAEVGALTARQIWPVIVTVQAFEDTLDRLYRDEHLQAASQYLVHNAPDNSASWVLSPQQKWISLAGVAAVSLGFALSPMWTATVLVALITVLYVAFSIYKFYLAYRAASYDAVTLTTATDIIELDDRELPIYTILVPMYHEAEILPTIVRAIGALDYPKAKLDVQLLLEADDHETIAAAHESRLPQYFRLVVVPSGSPRGKPRACNYGLLKARGEYVVIYDAEDIPEPDQLKKSLLVFNRSDDRLACVQAKLNYFNRDQNLLTRWFTAEYSMWFDLFLPGLSATNAPIPLGGTSNHFRTALLRDLGAWDPHNVTEDADLGVRLYKASLKTAVIESTTYEEANSELYNWVRQRSRWIKGYIQTYLVHMRHPIRLWRSLGPGGFLSFQCMIGGTPFLLLANPLFWGLTAAWFSWKWGFIEQLFVGPIYYAGLVALCIGNFTFMYLNLAGCMRRGYFSTVKYALLSPLYWVLMSAAAWKGFLQLFHKPSYWEKTRHGLYNETVTIPDGAFRVPEVSGPRGAHALDSPSTSYV